jgi:hypothetical protein
LIDRSKKPETSVTLLIVSDLTGNKRSNTPETCCSFFKNLTHFLRSFGAGKSPLACSDAGKTKNVKGMWVKGMRNLQFYSFDNPVIQ